MKRVWRITTRKFADSAFDGEGARLYGGRWNQPNMSMVYCAEHLSLAALELLVNQSRANLKQNYVAIPVDIPPQVALEIVSSTDLPDDWRRTDGHRALQDMGTNWLKSATTPILVVPSVVIPHENNYLLNPHHPRMEELIIGEPHPFEFDPRLIS